MRIKHLKGTHTGPTTKLFNNIRCIIDKPTLIIETISVGGRAAP